MSKSNNKSIRKYDPLDNADYPIGNVTEDALGGDFVICVLDQTERGFRRTYVIHRSILTQGGKPVAGPNLMISEKKDYRSFMKEAKKRPKLEIPEETTAINNFLRNVVATLSAARDDGEDISNSGLNKAGIKFLDGLDQDDQSGLAALAVETANKYRKVLIKRPHEVARATGTKAGRKLALWGPAGSGKMKKYLSAKKQFDKKIDLYDALDDEAKQRIKDESGYYPSRPKEPPSPFGRFDPEDCEEIHSLWELAMTDVGQYLVPLPDVQAAGGEAVMVTTNGKKQREVGAPFAKKVNDLGPLALLKLLEFSPEKSD
jgi:hypothetical protein